MEQQIRLIKPFLATSASIFAGLLLIAALIAQVELSRNLMIHFGVAAVGTAAVLWLPLYVYWWAERVRDEHESKTQGGSLSFRLKTMRYVFAVSITGIITFFVIWILEASQEEKRMRLFKYRMRVEKCAAASRRYAFEFATHGFYNTIGFGGCALAPLNASLVVSQSHPPEILAALLPLNSKSKRVVAVGFATSVLLWVGNVWLFQDSGGTPPAASVTSPPIGMSSIQLVASGNLAVAFQASGDSLAAATQFARPTIESQVTVSFDIDGRRDSVAEFRSRIRRLNQELGLILVDTRFKAHPIDFK